MASKTITINIEAPAWPAAVEFANFRVEISLDVAARECANLYRDTNRTICGVRIELDGGSRLHRDRKFRMTYFLPG